MIVGLDDNLIAWEVRLTLAFFGFEVVLNEHSLLLWDALAECEFLLEDRLTLEEESLEIILKYWSLGNFPEHLIVVELVEARFPVHALPLLLNILNFNV